MTPDDFETSLQGLERAVGALERGDLELAAALAAYEDGVGRLGRCLALLEGAERRVLLLAGADQDGNPTAVPFDAAATADPPSEPAPKPRRGRRAAAPKADDDPPF